MSRGIFAIASPRSFAYTTAMEGLNGTTELDQDGTEGAIAAAPSDADPFDLNSAPNEVQHQFVREVVARTIAKRRRKQPHQAVTVKIPFSDYRRVTHVREGWELHQTDLIRFFFELALPVLEAPPQELRSVLEAHRDEIRSQRAAEARKRGLTE